MIQKKEGEKEEKAHKCWLFLDPSSTKEADDFFSSSNQKDNKA